MGEHVERDISLDAALIGEPHPFAEGKHLDGEDDVGGQLEQQRLAAVADEGHRAAELAQDRLDAFERAGVPADDDREAAFFRRRDVPKTGAASIEAPCAATRSASSRLV